MLLEPGGAGFAAPDALSESDLVPRWGVSSETGRLTDVLVAAPEYLSMIPCNEVTRASLALGLGSSRTAANAQHRAFVAALESAGVRCHFIPPASGLADLAFTRDAVLMSPWGLIELRPVANHRHAEPVRAAAAAAELGVPRLGRIEAGAIEGGDICMLRPGVLLVGCSGDRTDEAGATALGAIFEQRGWEVVRTVFDPCFLHLDTIFTMISKDCAVAYVDALDDGLLVQLARLGIGIIPASREDVAALGANLLSLGDGRIVAPAAHAGLNPILERSGFELIEVEIDQFTRCGGGAHCLTMPLARRADPGPG